MTPTTSPTRSSCARFEPSTRCRATVTTIEAELVRRMLTRLAPDQRDVLLLRVLGDLTVAQTAAVVGKSYEAVKALQRRGIATLRRNIDADEGVPR